ncbi:MAG: phage major capsid protein [Lachnospiraceae bacterium]
MALRKIMKQKELERKEAALVVIAADLATLEAREKELERAIDEAETDEEIETVEKSAEELEQELADKKAEKEKLEGEIAALEDEISKIDENAPTGDEGRKKMKGKRSEQELTEVRGAVDRFLRSKGQVRDGLVSEEADVLIPQDIVYTPTKEIDTVVDLAQYVKKNNVSAASGKYPMLKRAVAQLHTTAELQENPALAKPEFYEVSWSVDTYRGMLAISQEAIDDSEADLLGIVAENAEEQRINTTNALIAAQFKSFTAVGIDASTQDIVDEIKKILNVSLDSGYVKSFVVTQSFYQVLDTLKDKNGRYLLQDSITAGSPSTLLARPVYVVNDELLQVNAGTEEAPVYNPYVAFVGDLTKAVLYSLRAGITAKWADDTVYGQYLAVGSRLGISKADANAGYFVTVTGETEGA